MTADEEEAQALAGASLLEAIAGRRGVRAYLEREVERDVLTAILDVARWAPSGGNLQRWNVHVLTGEVKRALSAAMLDQRQRGCPERYDYQYYPTEWTEPYIGRRLATGTTTYAAYGTPRTDANRQAAWSRNYNFFGAPVGMMFFMHRDLGHGALLDYGMLMQNIMLAARAYGLESCPQAALAEYPDVVRTALGIGPEWLLAAGLSMGYPDWDAPINRFVRSRSTVPEFATFHG